uniref:Uncharacterized protein n=1 Tax=Anopheles albimanus TaxID=7167 RepID=A0A182FBF7_ANOAL
MTLERRLTSYDWENQFESFQDATRKGSFKPLCWTPTNTMLPHLPDVLALRRCNDAVFPFASLQGIEAEAYGSNITRSWKPLDKCRNVHTNLVTETGPNMIDMPAMDDHESTNMIDVDLKAKMSRSGQQTPPTTNHRQVGRSSATTTTAIILESLLLVTVAAAIGHGWWQ